MTDTEFSYSASKRNQSGTPLFSANNLDHLAGPPGTVLIRSRHTNQRQLVQPEVWQALAHCTAFRTVRQHAATVVQYLPEVGTSEDAAIVLDSLVNAGLLESATQAHRRCHSDALHDERDHGKPKLFILTCDRPKALERLLDSIAQHQLGPIIDSVTVVDDSSEPNHANANLALVEQLKAKLAFDAVYFGTNERSAFTKALKQALPQHESAIDFMLSKASWQSQPTYGVTRNWAQLLGIGRRNLVLDDDVICNAMCAPVRLGPLTAADTNAKRVVLFREKSALETQAVTLNDDPISLALASLGKNLSSMLSAPDTHDAAAKLAGMNGEVLSRYTSQSKAIITQAATWGDPGTQDEKWIVNLAAEQFARAVHDVTDIQQVLAARSCWSGYDAPTIVPYASISQFTGIDNRELLPPYLPAGRGEDLFFGVLTERLHPNHFTFNHPWAVPHMPIELRGSTEGDNGLSSWSAVNMIIDFLGSANPTTLGDSASERMRIAAEDLARLGRSNVESFVEACAHYQFSRSTQLLRKVMEHLARTDSDSVQSFLFQARDSILNDMQRGSSLPALFEVEATEVAAKIAAQQDLILGLSNGVAAWQDIRIAASNINNKNANEV